MKKLLLASFCVALLGCEAKADLFGDAMSIVNNPKTACARGNAFAMKFTVRSGGGAICATSKTIGAVAQLVCPGADSSFNDSDCNKRAKEALGGVDPADYLRETAAGNAPGGSDSSSKMAKQLYEGICTSKNTDLNNVKTRLKCPA